MTGSSSLQLGSWKLSQSWHDTAACMQAQGGSGVYPQEVQVPPVAASLHDSVNTVGSVAINKAIQGAQAQAQGMESQVAPPLRI